MSWGESSLEDADHLFHDQPNKPFMTITLPDHNTRITSLTFSNSGETILVGGNDGQEHYIYDSFDPNSRLLFTLHPTSSTLVSTSTATSSFNNFSAHPLTSTIPGQDLCWSCDARFVLAQSRDERGNARVCIWEIPPLPKEDNLLSKPMDLYPLAQLLGPSGSMNVVAFNPRRAMFVTAGEKVCFWLPAQDQLVAPPILSAPA